MLFLSSERLGLSYVYATLDCDCNNSPDYLKVAQMDLTFNFENNAAQWSMTGGISIMYHLKAY